jgi:hypothetical protein
MDRPPAIGPVSRPKSRKRRGAGSLHGIREVFAQHQIIADAAEPVLPRRAAWQAGATPFRQVSAFQ